ncbi:LysE family translocator [Patiriisocius sp. Uisw_017]|uniref:LysE family translocator n=1 Tax=Patiriisocius sp. Uisw_017 TaxID=3230968 RepID=UPI0039E8FBCC
MLENLYLFSLATMALAISPGPDNIYVLTQAMVNGTKSGIATTAGLISGCIVHTTLLAFGVSALVTANENVFYAIKIFGAVYLLYLAYQVFKSDGTISFSTNAPKKSHRELFKQGVIMNLLNPKVMVFFLSFFPAFLWEPSLNTVSQFYILGITFMIVSFLVFSLVALLAGSISNYTLKHKGIGVFMKWLQIIVFVGIAIFIMIPS